ncbi:MAG: hypothetical protein V4484_01370 [Pseudomonadota bacterium]
MRHLLLALTACCLVAQAGAAPSLDLAIAYYSKVTTPEGVTREARYEERMLRRPDHIWVTRSLPPLTAPAAPGMGHAEFNPVMLARHVVQQDGKLRLEYVDRKARQLIAVPPSEYANVSFDGSWDNAWYVLDPKRVQTLPVSSRRSTVAGAVWREREQGGNFERVLWDGQRQVPLVIESGDRAGTVFHRVAVTVLPGLAARLPWLALQGFSQKEYADFLD